MKNSTLNDFPQESIKKLLALLSYSNYNKKIEEFIIIFYEENRIIPTIEPVSIL